MRAWLLAALMVPLLAMPAMAQHDPDRRVDVRQVKCFDVLAADREDRIAAIFFYYGLHAGIRSIWVVSPRNLEEKARRVVEICQANPDMAVFEATPKAFE